jgi:hypothetical protein
VVINILPSNSKGGFVVKRIVIGCLVLIVFCFSVQVLYAHICHSVFMTPGLLAVRPEKDVSTLSKSDEFKVYAQNNYMAPLTNIKLTAATEDTDVNLKVTPGVITRLRPGERGEFTVNISVKDTKQRNFALKFSVTAKQLKMRPVEEPTEAELNDAFKRAYLDGQFQIKEVLVRRGKADAVDFLKRVISRDETFAPRRSQITENAGRAARLVGRMGHKEFAPYLRERYKVEELSWIRASIIIGLAFMGFEEDRKLFSEASLDKDQFLKASGLLGLTMTGDKEAAEKLKFGMDLKDGRTRMICAWGRAIHKDPGAIKLLQDVVDQKEKNMTLPPLPGDEKWQGVGGNTDYSMRILSGDALLDISRRDQ